jgi:hypothetical protein
LSDLKATSLILTGSFSGTEQVETRAARRKAMTVDERLMNLIFLGMLREMNRLIEWGGDE